MNRINHPVELKGDRVSLVPLGPEHFEELCLLAKDGAIWKYSPVGVNGFESEKLIAFMNSTLEKRTSGEQYPFVVIFNRTGKIAGSTIFHSIHLLNKSLEIGCTWFHPQYWSSGINTECKFLMLRFCFEILEVMRVQIKTSHNNIRSRKAIEKIGASFEGILRKDKMLEDGSIRNAAYYSIIDDEWKTVKSNLEKILNLRYELD